ncbi:MAG: hypothetical protein LBI13_05850 [Streptococcaceae bacterium]|jgi:accessory secretory protein Asp2|nr:hypothetical protein [Streptococcaceae bacterium]
MKYLQINGQNWDEIDEIRLDDYLAERPVANYLLVDCQDIEVIDLKRLIDSVRSRYILYRGATKEQKQLLDEFGHFDISKIWEFKKLAQELDFMLDDLVQTQGFSATPDEAARLSDNFQGRIERHGRYEMLIEGDFPEETVVFDLQRLVKNWSRNVYVIPFRRFYNAPGRHKLIFDYQTKGDIKVTYLIFTLDHQGNLLKTDRITEKEYLFEAAVNVDFQGQVLIQGKGTATLGKVWTYKDKQGLGWFQAGDRRDITSEGEAVHSLYLPGKKKEKLIVGFSGNLSELPHYERQSMANYGFPVLLFCDLRARGGAFHIGKKTYEETLTALIDEKLTELGLHHQDLILIGWSMGSFPAMYYGLKMQVGEVIAAKPLLHLGQVTDKVEVAFRSEPSMIEARHYLTGNYRAEDTAKLDAIIEEALASSDPSQTNFHVFMMKNDELDHCEQLFENLKAHAKSVSIRKEAGFHSEKIPQMSRWIDEVLESFD